MVVKHLHSLRVFLGLEGESLHILPELLLSPGNPPLTADVILAVTRSGVCLAGVILAVVQGDDRVAEVILAVVQGDDLLADVVLAVVQSDDLGVRVARVDGLVQGDGDDFLAGHDDEVVDLVVNGLVVET